jgi:hypothetical protein
MKFPRIYTDEQGETHIGIRDIPQREARVARYSSERITSASVKRPASFCVAHFANCIPGGFQVPSPGGRMEGGVAFGQ